MFNAPGMALNPQPRTLCRAPVFDAKGCAYDQVAVVCLVVADVSFILAPPFIVQCSDGLNPLFPGVKKTILHRS
jgi:hypothetical protein